MLGELLLKDLYLVPLTGSILIAIYACLLLAPKKKKAMKKLTYNTLDKPFAKTWENDLYTISYQKPVSSFLPEDDLDKKAIEANQKIAQAGYSGNMDYRVLTTLQFILLALAIVLTVVFGFLLTNSLSLWCSLFNLKPEEVSPMTVFLVIGCTLLLCAFFPKIYISSKAGNVRTEFIKNLPILQIFLVSMIKSGRPISDVLYTLGNADTVYKSIFSNAYRIYVRDKEGAFDFLSTAFADTGWVNTIMVLRTAENFSKKETCKVLSNQLRDLEEEVSTMKGGKRNLKSLISEGSIALPFCSLMLLGVVPVIMYAFGMVNTAMSMAG